MYTEEALALLDQLLPGTLSNLQETVFCQVWEDKTYAEIADEYSYEHSYIRDVGFRLWQALSKTLGEKVSKSNVKAILSRYARSQAVTSSLPPTTSTSLPEVEYPNGPVPINSPLYIERPPIEVRAYTEIRKPGSLIRLKGPRQTGKTSLLKRMLYHAKSHSMATVSLSFHRVDHAILQDLDRFLRWFCTNVSYQLGIAPKLDDYWNSDIGSKVSCTLYLEEYLLIQVQTSIVIALDEVNELFQFSQVSAEFLPLLRSWYEDARESESWRRVRWILSHATDIYVPLQLKQSPFNVGLSIPLPEFSVNQVRDLAHRHGLTEFGDEPNVCELRHLVDVIGSRPGLVRLALYHLSQKNATIKELIANAHTQSGIYSDHLRHMLAAIYPHKDLQLALLELIEMDGPMELPPIIAYRLESIGLIKIEGNLATISCKLYSKFFWNGSQTNYFGKCQI